MSTGGEPRKEQNQRLTEESYDFFLSLLYSSEIEMTLLLKVFLLQLHSPILPAGDTVWLTKDHSPLSSG